MTNISLQLKKSDVRRFYNSLADVRGLKIATIDNIHNVLHQVFQVAVDDGMIRQNPTDNMLKELKLSHGFEREKKQCMTYRFHKNVVQKCPKTLRHHTPQNTPIDCPLAEFGVI